MKKIVKIARSLDKKRILMILVSFVIVLSGIIFMWISTFKLPDLENYDTRKVLQSTKIYDRTGQNLLYSVHEDIKRTVVSGDLISRHVKNATVAIEDEEFYKHKGIKPKSILRAILANLKTGRFSQGGSTITQQVVKNAFLTTDKKISRKIKEWVLAPKLEQVMDKDTILTLYLNEVPYGGSIYGIEEASQVLLGKSAKDLTLTESAYLAALPQAPTYFSPYGNHSKELENRKNLVLLKMKENSFISEEEYNNAKKESVTWRPAEEKGIKAPHFVLFVKEYLENVYGKESVEQLGLRVITTLDYDLQKKGEEIVSKYAEQNREIFDAENGALVALDPNNGQILTMVGSKDYFSKEIQGNFNVVLAHRQPGSSFKPIVYAAALEKGYTPETMIFDVPTQFSTTCTPEGQPIAGGECYAPQNFDEKFRGPVSMRSALAQSLNIPSIKVLYLTGINQALKLARAMGISTLEGADRYGLTLVLGGGEITLLELTSAYTVFAEEGVRNPYAFILRIEDKDGNVISQFKENKNRVLSEEVARKISSMLSDNEARIPTFGSNSPLHFQNRDVAVKTGTTNDYKDAWVIGYTPSVAVGAWVGNNDNRPMKKASGLRVAPMWRAFMDEALKISPTENFNAPEIERDNSLPPVLRGFWQGDTSYTIDRSSGKLASNFTPAELREERVVREVHTILHWIDKDNPRGGRPQKPQDDSQYDLWEYGVKKWAASMGLVNESPDIIPKESDDSHNPDKAPVVSIASPITGTYNTNSRIVVKFGATTVYPIMKSELYINGNLVASTNGNEFSFIPKELDLQDGTSVLRVIVTDSLYNKGESSVSINITR